jgi:hypothetical protein
MWAEPVTPSDGDLRLVDLGQSKGVFAASAIQSLVFVQIQFLRKMSNPAVATKQWSTSCEARHRSPPTRISEELDDLKQKGVLFDSKRPQNRSKTGQNPAFFRQESS